MSRWNVAWQVLAVGLAVVGGCTAADEQDGGASHDEHAQAMPTNRVPVPSSVRQNLGITFADVERRRVASTVRVPGRFEWLPTARREYRTPLSGRVELLVEQYDRVEPGDVVYRLDSPEWRARQREIEDTMTQIDVTEARLEALEATMEAHELHEQGLREAVALWEERVVQLEQVIEAGGGRASELADARSKLNEARSAFGEVMEKHADLRLRESELQSGHRAATSRADLLLRSAASILGVPFGEVTSPNESESEPVPLWKATDLIEVHATAAGVVEQLAVTNGAWAERGELVASGVDPDAIRFRAVGLQSDLAHLRSGLPARIVPPRGSDAPDAGIEGKLEMGLTADPEQRTVDLFVKPAERTLWTRAGVSAFLEVVLNETAEPELAIPLSCVVRDGITPFIFRRDPANPNEVIRIEADLGLDDGRWVVVKSGVMAGDEIVRDGAYQLMIATSDTSQQGGHFHADGTFHADDEH